MAGTCCPWPGLAADVNRMSCPGSLPAAPTVAVSATVAHAPAWPPARRSVELRAPGVGAISDPRQRGGPTILGISTKWFATVAPKIAKGALAVGSSRCHQGTRRVPRSRGPGLHAPGLRAHATGLLRPCPTGD